MNRIRVLTLAVTLLTVLSTGCTTPPQLASAEEVKGQYPHVTRVRFAF